MHARAKTSEALLQSTKAQLEKSWKGFEAQVNTYFDTVGSQFQQRQANFRNAAAAQVKAWREAADKLQAEATKVAAAKRAEIDAAVAHMKADAAEADARLQNLKQAGTKSWSVLSAALADSRKTFDQANQKAWEIFKRAIGPAT